METTGVRHSAELLQAYSTIQHFIKVWQIRDSAVTFTLAHEPTCWICLQIFIRSTPNRAESCSQLQHIAENHHNTCTYDYKTAVFKEHITSVLMLPTILSDFFLASSDPGHCKSTKYEFLTRHSSSSQSLKKFSKNIAVTVTNIIFTYCD
jgi:hypothetical protein